MRENLVHALAWIAAASTLAVIVAGAIVTNSLTNSLAMPSTPGFAGLFSRAGHQHAAEAVGVLVMVLAIGAWLCGKESPARRWAWVPLVLVIAQIGLGHAAGKSAAMISLLHAFLAPILLASIAALVLASSPAWRRSPVMLQDKGWPPMRGFARITFLMVVLQALLGAAFRHGALGVMPHIVGALVVAILLLILVICITQMPGEALLKPAAISMLVMAAVQIFLGLTVISMNDKTMAQTAGLIVSTAHVALGALTLAVGAVVAIEARCCARPQA